LPLEIARTTLRRRDDQQFSPVTQAVILAAQAVADDYASRGLFPAQVDVRPYFDASVFRGPRGDSFKWMQVEAPVTL
jgi:hypothetical protein